MPSRAETVRSLLQVAGRLERGELALIVGVREIAERGDAFFGTAGLFEVLQPFMILWGAARDLTVSDRAQWAPDFLARIDLAAAEFEARERARVVELCAALIAAFAPLLRACTVCGYVAAPDDLPRPCRCCAFAHGSDDAAEAWREQWLRDGMPFRGGEAPDRWAPVAQMHAAGISPW